MTLTRLDLQDLSQTLTDIITNILSIETNMLKASDYSDITIGEMQMIVIIGSQGQARPSYVAKRLKVSVSTVTVGINRLVDKGYVTRTQSTTDRRVKELTLTRKGNVVYRLHRRLRYQMMKDVVANSTSRESAGFAKGILALNSYLEGIT